MNPRSKKYYENHKEEKGDKKGSMNEGGYNEQNTATQTKNNPAPSKTQGHPKEDAPASQDDTGGGNDSGKRSDNN